MGNPTLILDDCDELEEHDIINPTGNTVDEIAQELNTVKALTYDTGTFEDEIKQA